LKIDGDEETLTVDVIYDTLKLYGTVTGSQSFTVVRK